MLKGRIGQEQDHIREGKGMHSVGRKERMERESGQMVVTEQLSHRSTCTHITVCVCVCVCMHVKLHLFVFK